MTVKIGINGFGRIGRSFYRALSSRNSSSFKRPLEVVAINDLTDAKTLAYLAKYDTEYGSYLKKAVGEEGRLLLDDRVIAVSAERNPENIPWRALGVNIVIEATGHFTSQGKAEAHLRAGASKVIISAPAGTDVPTFVMGVNNQRYNPQTDDVVSNASCTTNCLAPLAKVFHDRFGIIRGIMTTVHAYTADQNLQDAPHSDLRRARAAAQNIVPTSTGAAKAIGMVLPELEGRLDGYALRVPVLTGSITDLTVDTKRELTEAEINEAYREAAGSGSLRGILQYCDEPIVSSDIVGNPHSSIFDAGLTKAVGTQVKISSWYDNEWGYSSRLVDLAGEIAGAL